MPKLIRVTNHTVYAEDVIAAEYRQLGLFRRLVLRWVSRDLDKAAAHLARNPRGYVNVPVVSKDGPFDHLASDLIGAGGSKRR